MVHRKSPSRGARAIHSSSSISIALLPTCPACRWIDNTAISYRATRWSISWKPSPANSICQYSSRPRCSSYRVRNHTRANHGGLTPQKGAFEADHVVVATGREKYPHIPDWPGRSDFNGEILHAAALGDISRYAGRDIMVIGAGNSGTDILNHLSRVATGKVWVSLRHGPTIMPTRLFGFPMHRLARLFALLPLPTLDAALALTQRLVYGNLSR